MNRGFLLSMLIAVALPVTVSAQVGTTGWCATLSQPPLAIDPPAASTSQAVTITVSKVGFLARSVGAEVMGKVINVTMTGISFGFPPPPPVAVCGTVRVGPLAQGSYTVNYFLVTDDGTPSLQASATLLVFADAVPTLTPLGTAILGILIGLFTLTVFRLKRDRAAG